MNVALRKRRLKDGKRTSLYLDFYTPNGKRRYEYLDLYLTGDKQQDKQLFDLAKSIKAKRELEIKNDEFGFQVAHKGEANFLDFYERIMATKKSIGGYTNTLRHLKLFLASQQMKTDVLKFSEVKPILLQEFQAYLLRNIKQETARGLFHNIRHILQKAVELDLIPKNPTDKIESIKRVQAQRHFLSEDELRRLAQTYCSHSDVKRAFLFSCFCGLRFGDVRELLWQNIHGKDVEITQEKTKEAIYVPLSKTALTILGERGKPDEKVFKLPTTGYTNLTLKSWLGQAKIEKHITFHSARHTFATLALTRGADIYSISKLLGHSRVETTQVYTKVIDSKKREAVDRLPEIEVSL
jgi:integrase